MLAMKMKRGLTIVASIAGMSGGLFAVGLAATPSAYAAGTSLCVRNGCDLFQYGPDNGYILTAPGDTPISMICWTDAQWYDGTNRWFKISDWYGTGTNWTSANEVQASTQKKVNHC
jgi:hypothetical protein